MSSKNERNIMAVLEQAGYHNSQKITDTLQGIYILYDIYIYIYSILYIL